MGTRESTQRLAAVALKFRWAIQSLLVHEIAIMIIIIIIIIMFSDKVGHKGPQ